MGTESILPTRGFGRAKHQKAHPPRSKPCDLVPPLTLQRTIVNTKVREALLEGRSLVYTTSTQNHLEGISHLHDGLFFFDPCPLYKSHRPHNSCGRIWPEARGEVSAPPTPMSSGAQHPMWLDEGHREHGSLHEKAKPPAVPGAGTWCHRASCEKLLFQVSNKDTCQQITAQDSSEGCGVGPRSSPADTMPATGYILLEQLDTKGWGGGAAAWGFWHQDQ